MKNVENRRGGKEKVNRKKKNEREKERMKENEKKRMEKKKIIKNFFFPILAAPDGCSKFGLSMAIISVGRRVCQPVDFVWRRWVGKSVRPSFSQCNHFFFFLLLLPFPAHVSRGSRNFLLCLFSSLSPFDHHYYGAIQQHWLGPVATSSIGLHRASFIWLDWLANDLQKR